MKGGFPCSGLISADPDHLEGCQQMARFLDDQDRPWCSQECMFTVTNPKSITQSELNRLVQQLADLRVALEPFAAFAECLPEVVEGSPRVTDSEGVALNCFYLGKNYNITFGNLRLAKALLEALKKEDFERWVKVAEDKMGPSHAEQVALLLKEADAIKCAEIEKMVAERMKTPSEKPK